MKVIRNGERGRVSFSEIKVGDCFEYGVENRSFHMKTSSSEGGFLNAVNLETGAMGAFTKAFAVFPVVAEVIIK